MRRPLFALLVLLLPMLAYAGISALALNNALHPLRKPVQSTPVADGFPAEPLHLITDDGIAIVGWFMPSSVGSSVRSSARRAVVFVHGMDSHGWTGYHKDAARAYLAAGIDAVVFDLRGQGDSGGERIGLGWKERADVAAVVAELRRRGYEPGSIGLHGSSYGGGTSILAAASIPEIGAVLVDCPWADIRPMVASELELRTGLGDFFVPGVVMIGELAFDLDLERHEPLLHVDKIAPRALLIVVGEQDDRIPAAHSRMLFHAARGDKQLWAVQDAGHTAIWQTHPEEFQRRAVAFFQEKLRA